MKVLIKPITDTGKIVMSNLEQIAKIFSNPGFRFSLRCTLPRKWRRAVLQFKLVKGDGGFYYSQDGAITTKGKSDLFKSVDKLIKECDGEPSDVSKELIL